MVLREDERDVRSGGMPRDGQVGIIVYFVV